MSNWEENENLRQEFVDKTNLKLWSEELNQEAGFSDEYVFWLEALVLETLNRQL